MDDDICCCRGGEESAWHDYYCQSLFWQYCRVNRQGPFRYFDLPVEIRYTILDLLLVRGTVAMTQDVAIKQRFRHWNHARPEWALLSGVSRQMQNEASDVVYSAKNTFFVPLGSIDDCWWIPRPYPQVKRLDIGFDLRDIKEDSAYTLDCVKRWHDGPDRTPAMTPFEELTNAERWRENEEGLTCYVWPYKTDAWIRINNLDLLRLDLTNCRCPVGCCRLGPTLLGFLDNNHEEGYQYPKRIEIVGILEMEQRDCRDALAQHGQVPLDRVFFVDSKGCTCKEETSCNSTS